MPSLQALIVLSQSGPAANALICSRGGGLPDAPKAAAVGDPSLIGAGTSGPAVVDGKGAIAHRCCNTHLPKVRELQTTGT
jgi:hypothetical protein